MPAQTVDFWPTFLIGTIGLLTLGAGFVSILFIYQRSRLSHEREKREVAERNHAHLQDLYNEARAMQEDLSKLSQAILKVQEEERQRISRELHDDVGQMLSAITVNLEIVKRDLASHPQAILRRLSDSQELTREVVGVVRHFLCELRPEILDQSSLIHAIKLYASRFSERTGILVKVTEQGEVEFMNTDQRLALYRVVQESLTNTAKHARARRIEITFSRRDGFVWMEILDDGIGFKLSDRNTDRAEEEGIRLGVIGMRERTRLVGGTFDIHSQPGEGTRISVGIPVDS